MTAGELILKEKYPTLAKLNEQIREDNQIAREEQDEASIWKFEGVDLLYKCKDVNDVTAKWNKTKNHLINTINNCIERIFEDEEHTHSVSLRQCVLYYQSENTMKWHSNKFIYAKAAWELPIFSIEDTALLKKIHDQTKSPDIGELLVMAVLEKRAVA